MKPFTEEEKQIIRDNYEREGPRSLARELKRNHKTVQNWASRHGLVFGPAKTKRFCLKCGREFWSSGKGNRICAGCRVSNDDVLDFYRPHLPAIPVNRHLGSE